MTWIQRIMATVLLVRDALQLSRQRGDLNTKLLFEVIIEIGVKKSGVMTCNRFVEILTALEPSTTGAIKSR